MGHVFEKVSLSRLLIFVDAAIQLLLGTSTPLAPLALQFLVGLPNSRTQELEADLVGLRLMSKACFEPGAVVECVHCFIVAQSFDSYLPLNLALDFGRPLGNKIKVKYHNSYLHTPDINNEQRYLDLAP